jgi:Protein of unknown function (DUF2911)
MLMLRRNVLTAAVLAATLPSLAFAADRGEAKAMVASKAVSIDYGRPLLNGRDMLGQAVVGNPWRMGADAATQLKTDADLAFGEVHVAKGTYVLTATKVADDKWQLNITSTGTDKKKIGDVPLVSSKLPASVEQFTIELKGEKDKGDLTLSWGTLAMKTSFTGK